MIKKPKKKTQYNDRAMAHLRLGFDSPDSTPHPLHYGYEKVGVDAQYNPEKEFRDFCSHSVFPAVSVVFDRDGFMPVQKKSHQFILVADLGNVAGICPSNTKKLNNPGCTPAPNVMAV